MIAIEEMYRKESRKQTLELAQIFLQLNSKLDVLLMFKKTDKRFASILFYEYNIHTKCNCCMKHEFYLLNDVFYIKQQNVNLLFRIMLYPIFK
jgi:hypothetical protein